MTTKLCPICRDTLPLDSFLSTCANHSFCKDCLLSYLKFKLPNFQEEPSCPGEKCKVRLTFKSLDKILELKEFSELSTFKEKAEKWKKVESGKWVECPKETCQVLMKPPWFSSWAKCGECDSRFCIHCKKDSHGKSICLASKKENFSELKKMCKLRECPKCLTPIERTEGCNNMLCSKCKTKFCWLCGDRIWGPHFFPLNPLGCTSSSSTNANHIYKWRILKFFLMLLAIYFGYLFVRLAIFLIFYAKYVPGLIFIIFSFKKFKLMGFLHLYWTLEVMYFLKNHFWKCLGLFVICCIVYCNMSYHKKQRLRSAYRKLRLTI